MNGREMMDRDEGIFCSNHFVHMVARRWEGNW